jgi:DNA-binding MarR family transcriptional regulator
MVYLVQEFIDTLFWKLNRILDQEGVSVLQWAFMQRAFLDYRGVRFSMIFKATGESKDNVRRAAASLQNSKVGNVIADPDDRRARIFTLTKRGRSRTLSIQEAFRTELLALVGAREDFSQRATGFTLRLWDASGFLAPGDLAGIPLNVRREENRAGIADDSLRFVAPPEQKKPTWNLDESMGEPPF